MKRCRAAKYLQWLSPALWQQSLLLALPEALCALYTDSKHETKIYLGISLNTKLQSFKIKQRIHESCVPDQEDPYRTVCFWDSWIRIIYLYGSGILPSFNKQKMIKTLYFYCFLTSFFFTFRSGSAFRVCAKISRVETLHKRMPSKIWKLCKQMFTNYNHITSRVYKTRVGSIANIYAASATKFRIQKLLLQI